MSYHLGYTMTAEVKVMRRKHMIKSRVGMTAFDFINSLKEVPADAVVDEVIADCEGDYSVFSIEFHEEVVERE